MPEPSKVARFCPQCGQNLVLPTEDLRRAFRCPRCGTKHAAADLVDLATPLSAVPASDLQPARAPNAQELTASLDGAPPAPPMTPQAPRVTTAPMRTRTAPMAAVSPSPSMGRCPPAAVDAPPAADATKLAAQPFAPAPTHADWARHDHPPPAMAQPRPAPGPAAGYYVPATPPPYQPQQVASPGQWAGAPHAQNFGRVAEGVGGAAAAAGSSVLSGAGALDRILHGRRRYVVALTALLVLVAPWLDDPTDSTFGTASVALFGALLLVLLLARVDGLRDERGWRLELLQRALTDAWDATTEFLQRMFEAPLGRKAMDAGVLLVQLGLFTAASANLLAWVVDADTASDLRYLGIASILLGGVAWWWGRQHLRAAGRMNGLAVAPGGQHAVEEAVRLLPELVDCADAENVKRIASHVQHPLVARVLAELADWRPRAYYDDEREYQDKLIALLKRKLPESEPAPEVQIGPTDRVDILLAGSVLIEMKANLTGTGLDRMAGQALSYLTTWRGRGPLLLVLCRTEARYVDTLAQRVREMRQLGHSVTAVLAAPKLSQAAGRR